MNLQIIAALVAIAISFSTGWRLSENNYLKKEAANEQQKLADQRLAAEAAIRQSQAVIAAQNAAAARNVQLRRDADGARSALVGLSNAADQAMRNAETSHATCLATAASATVVLNQCGERYRSLAVTADSHASDVKTLVDAWPK